VSTGTKQAQEQGHRPYFDALYAASDDPYASRQRWYEARKRAVLLAALPQPGS
jgi:hypothetical protein